MDIRPTWMEVSLGNIRHNYRELKSWIEKNGAKDARVFCVIKANAYGMGAVPTAWALKQEGADYFLVATMDEAIELRDGGIMDPILVLGPAIPDAAGASVRLAVRSSISDIDGAKALSDEAVRQGKKAYVHIALDTGMGRIGFLPDEAVEKVKQIAAMPGIEIEGAFTHFSTSDEKDLTFTEHQHKLFVDTIAAVEAAGIKIPMPHCCNSGATLMRPQWAMAGVRPGHLLHGLYPSNDVPRDIVDIRPCMSVKTHIAVIRTLPKGSSVSYGRTYRTTEETETFAVLPIGYADGFQRGLSNNWEVLIGGKRCPIAGRICMDQCMARVDGVDAKPGDEVVIIGKQGSEELTVDEYAARLGWITGQVTCAMKMRLPKVYVD